MSPRKKRLRLAPQHLVTLLFVLVLLLTGTIWLERVYNQHQVVLGETTE